MKTGYQSLRNNGLFGRMYRATFCGRETTVQVNFQVGYICYKFSATYHCLVADAHPVSMPLVEVVAARDARPRRAERVRAVQDVVQLLTSPALEKDHEILTKSFKDRELSDENHILIILQLKV